MKKSNSNKKLTLNKMTITSLNNLENIQGGRGIDSGDTDGTFCKIYMEIKQVPEDLNNDHINGLKYGG